RHGVANLLVQVGRGAPIAVRTRPNVKIVEGVQLWGLGDQIDRSPYSADARLDRTGALKDLGLLHVESVGTRAECTFAHAIHSDALLGRKSAYRHHVAPSCVALSR